MDVRSVSDGNSRSFSELERLQVNERGSTRQRDYRRVRSQSITLTGTKSCHQFASAESEAEFKPC